jgi:hypothetical protein
MANRRRRLEIEKLMNNLTTAELARGFGSGNTPSHEQGLEYMRGAHERGSEFAAIDAMNYCRETRTAIPEWIFHAINDHFEAHLNEGMKQKKSGRHAHPAAECDDWFFDQLCAVHVSAMQARGKSRKLALIETAEVLGPDWKWETVRKACARAKKPRPDWYFSEFIASR